MAAKTPPSRFSELVDTGFGSSWNFIYDQENIRAATDPQAHQAKPRIQFRSHDDLEVLWKFSRLIGRLPRQGQSLQRHCRLNQRRGGQFRVNRIT